MKKINGQFPGSRERPIVWDLTFPSSKPRAVVVFLHGFKGYKDWGPWNAIAAYFAGQGYAFAKFNFSFNGGTADNPVDFPDLDAFSRNNYSTELDDCRLFMEHLRKQRFWEQELPMFLIGHSRGGGIALLVAAEDNALNAVISWAGVTNFEERFPSTKELELWRKEGVRYIANARTGQQMPQGYQFYSDFVKNRDLLNIERAVRKLQVPLLAVHGDSDTVVDPIALERINNWLPGAETCLVKGAGHTFNTVHPFNDQWPPEMMQTVQHTLNFLGRNC